MRYHSRDTNSRRTVKSPRTPVSRPRSVNRPKSSSDGIRACMRLLLAACGLTGRHYMPGYHMCCLFPCKTPEKKIVHVFSLSALPRTASVPVDIQPSCLRIRPAPLLFGHSPYGRFPPMRYHSRDINARQTTTPPPTAVSCPRSARGHSAEIARDAHDPRSFYAPKIARSIGCCP